MALPSGFIQSLLAMHPREVIDALQQRDWKPCRLTIQIEKEVRPSDLFCYLGARFGRPNGIQNFLRSDDSDNLIHWDWTVRHDRGIVQFLGMNFRTEVNIMGLAPGDEIKSDLIEQLRSDFSNHGAEMGKVRQALEHWSEFVNPYQRVRRTVERLLRELERLNLRPEHDQCEPLCSSAASRDEVGQRWNDLTQRYSLGFGLCFGIRSMLPVLAEAFVNLLLYMLLRPEIRSDSRLADSVFRQPIDVRIKALSINCTGFKCQPDYSTDVCRAYHRLVNERNDLLHGNVVVDKLKFNDVYFWGKVPVFKEYRSVWGRTLQVEAESVGLAAVRSELATVNALTEYLLSCLEETVREKIGYMVQRYHLGFNQQTGGIGVLFPEWLVDILPEGSESGGSDREV